jgi:hypothetical protein
MTTMLNVLEKRAHLASLAIDVEGVTTTALGKLEACGSSRQIHDYFVEQKIQGRRGRAYACPIAQFVNDALGVADYQVTCADTLVVAIPLRAVRVPTPPAVADFIRDFDGGSYPDLVDPLFGP